MEKILEYCTFFLYLQLWRFNIVNFTIFSNLVCRLKSEKGKLSSTLLLTLSLLEQDVISLSSCIETGQPAHLYQFKQVMIIHIKFGKFYFMFYWWFEHIYHNVKAIIMQLVLEQCCSWFLIPNYCVTLEQCHYCHLLFNNIFIFIFIIYNHSLTKKFRHFFSNCCFVKSMLFYNLLF